MAAQMPCGSGSGQGSCSAPAASSVLPAPSQCFKTACRLLDVGPVFGIHLHAELHAACEPQDGPGQHDYGSNSTVHDIWVNGIILDEIRHT